ncbi:DUF523 and DUF1722 domain-containing protein [Romboutsia timonensis]|uniref:DUF523 and DUF1722 domain-containing protein n=1 Tax=Romboutsia timonensis TaxID=1776391 RepID=UPI002E7786B3|nr:DUF523 and DUF1722 domain-containing protein [Romboutsia timonensis]MEE0711860.1 DUF523 and DUF1722 domain-containing protein [Romboutsia timonensis]
MRKPKIVVSECLYGTKCRYDGQGYNDKVIQSLKDYVDIQTVCPELAIGLSIPREPIRIEMNKENEEYRLIDYNSKNDYTNQMTEFSEEFINGLDDIDGFILKSRSPTCGLKDAKVYYCGNKCSIRSNENGFFLQKIIDKYDYLPIENEGRLKNYNIRDNFFTRIFFINNLKNNKNIIEFHKNNLLLLKSYDEESTNEVSDILNENRMEDQVHQYKEKVLNIVSNQRKKENKLSIIIKVFEKYKNMLNEEEINMFNGLIESYENQRIPFSTLEVVIKMYATRFKDKDILNQTFFYPYPENLINITDSGKGRKL